MIYTIYTISSIVLFAIVLILYIQKLYFKINYYRQQIDRVDHENQILLERINELEERLDDLHHDILNNINNGMNVIIEENGEQAINNAAEFFQVNETNQHL